MGMEAIPILGKMISKQNIINQGIALKEQFLGRWSNDQIIALCKEKGIPTTETPIQEVSLEQTNPTTQISYRQLIKAVAKEVPGREIIWYSEKQGIDCKDFKEAYAVLVVELGKA